MNAHGHSLDFEMFPSQYSQGTTHLKDQFLPRSHKCAPHIRKKIRGAVQQTSHKSYLRNQKLVKRHHRTNENETWIANTPHFLRTWIVDFDFARPHALRMSRKKFRHMPGFVIYFIHNVQNISQRPIFSRFFCVVRKGQCICQPRQSCQQRLD